MVVLETATVTPKCVSDFLAVIGNGRILERGARKCVSDLSAARAKDRILDRGVRKYVSDLSAVPAKGRILDRGARKWLPEGAATEVPAGRAGSDGIGDAAGRSRPPSSRRGARTM